MKIRNKTIIVVIMLFLIVLTIIVINRAFGQFIFYSNGNVLDIPE